MSGTIPSFDIPNPFGVPGTYLVASMLPVGLIAPFEQCYEIQVEDVAYGGAFNPSNEAPVVIFMCVLRVVEFAVTDPLVITASEKEPPAPVKYARLSNVQCNVSDPLVQTELVTSMVRSMRDWCVSREHIQYMTYVGFQMEPGALWIERCLRVSGFESRSALEDRFTNEFGHTMCDVYADPRGDKGDLIHLIIATANNEATAIFDAAADYDATVTYDTAADYDAATNYDAIPTARQVIVPQEVIRNPNPEIAETPQQSARTKRAVRSDLQDPVDSLPSRKKRKFAPGVEEEGEAGLMASQAPSEELSMPTPRKRAAPRKKKPREPTPSKNTAPSKRIPSQKTLAKAMAAPSRQVGTASNTMTTTSPRPHTYPGEGYRPVPGDVDIEEGEIYEGPERTYLGTMEKSVKGLFAQEGRRMEEERRRRRASMEKSAEAAGETKGYRE